jgi:hypothetical protein
VQLAATKEWCVAMAGASFFVRLSNVPGVAEESHTDDDARRHAARLANALNRVYGFTFAPVFPESPEP